MNALNLEMRVAIPLSLPNRYLPRRISPPGALVITGNLLTVRAVNLRQLAEYPFLARCMPRCDLANLSAVLSLQ